MGTCLKCSIENSLMYQSEFHDVYGCDKCKKQRAIQIDDCCRSPLKIVIVEQTEKTIRLLHQCVMCGGIVNRHLPLSRKKYGDDIREEMNEYRFQEWKQRVHDDYLLIKEDIDKNNFEHSRYGKYMAYLGSPEWKTKRQMVLKRDSYLCQSCKQKEAVDVHHLSYDNLYNEILEELISVCVECHNKIHDDKDKKRLEELLNRKKSNNS